MTTDLINTNFKLDGISYSQKSLVSHFKNNKPYHDFLTSWFDGNDFIIVKTSGSTGSPKPIRLKKKDMISSARLTAKFFEKYDSSQCGLCLSGCRNLVGTLLDSAPFFRKIGCFWSLGECFNLFCVFFVHFSSILYASSWFLCLKDALYPSCALCWLD